MIPQISSGAIKPIVCIKEGWNLIKDDYWKFFLISLFAVCLVATPTLFSNSPILSSLFEMSYPKNQYRVTQNRSSFYDLILIFKPLLDYISISVSIIVHCGVFRALSKKSRTGTVNFSDLRVESSQIKTCLLVSLVIVVFLLILSFVVSIFFGIAFLLVFFSLSGRSPISSDTVSNIKFLIIAGGLIGLLFSTIIFITTTFTTPLIADRNLSTKETLKLSIKGGYANSSRLMALFFLIILMQIGGLLAFGIGTLFVAPLSFAALFVAYQSVFRRKPILRRPDFKRI